MTKIWVKACPKMSSLSYSKGKSERGVIVAKGSAHLSLLLLPRWQQYLTADQERLLGHWRPLEPNPPASWGTQPRKDLPLHNYRAQLQLLGDLIGISRIVFLLPAVCADVACPTDDNSRFFLHKAGVHRVNRMLVHLCKHCQVVLNAF